MNRKTSDRPRPTRRDFNLEPEVAVPGEGATPTVLLKPGEADRVLAGHPWIYEGCILRVTRPPQDGEVVQVKDHRQRFLGVGFFNSQSKIRVRMVSSERVAVDAGFFLQRVRTACALRRRTMPDATSFRVVNAESDFLTGLIVDKYEQVLVMQTSSLGMDQRKADIVAALNATLAPEAIMERNDAGARRFEGLAPTSDLLHGALPPEVAVRMNGLTFNLRIGEGHKTGLYLDQQANYRRVAELSRGATVLDCFCFQGGFGIHAARGGAVAVQGIDQSPEAVEAARQNAAANGVADRCTFEAANVFDWLNQQSTTGPHERLVPRYDVVILDPPSFTRTRAAIPEALRGYKEIHLRAMKLLKPGGKLITFCCSHHVSGSLFLEVIASAAYDAYRVLRLTESFSQGLDHPVITSIPETEYLKGFAFDVLPRP
jgi:23S rRNA (cytosine1962-C5)-methyltransferase